MITIVIAEDHRMVREGLSAGLQSQHGFKIVGEASDGNQALEIVRRLKPQILLLDLSLPNTHGLDVLRAVVELKKTKAIVVTMHSDEPYIVEAFRAGASAYVLKDSTTADLANAIRTVVQKGLYLSPAFDPALLREIRLTNSKAPAADPFTRLTRRERLILEMAAGGMKTSEIATKLFISPRTAETHRANLMRKLHLKSQTDLVKLAIRKNIISL